MFSPFATFGLGSIPFVAGENGSEKVFRAFEIPFWPQYPSRSIRENFVFQFLSSFPGLIASDESFAFNEKKYQEGRPGFSAKLDEAFAGQEFLPFEPEGEEALGYVQLKELLEKGRFPEKETIKLQVTGPETVWKSFFAPRVSGPLRQEVRRDLGRALTARGLAQIERIRKFGRKPLILIDEPILPRVSSELSEVVDAFKRFGAWTGLHVCSSSEWETLLPLQIDLFHFDLTAHPTLKLSQQNFLRRFLKARRYVAWGAVPTTPNPGFRAKDFSLLVLERMREITSGDLTLETMVERSLVAPACGTGRLGRSQDEAVWESLRLTKEGLETRFNLPIREGREQETTLNPKTRPQK